MASNAFAVLIVDDNLWKTQPDNRFPWKAAIARVTGVRERWLQMYVNQKYYQLRKQVELTKKTRKADASTR